MEVIIKKTTKKLGKAGEIIQVSDGYALNFLIPNKIVLPSYGGNDKKIKEDMRQAEEKQTLIKKQAIALAQKIKQKSISIEVKASDKGKIFGNITGLQIAKALNEKITELNVTHDQIILPNPVDTLGTHTIELKLHKDVQTEITIELKAS